MKYFILRQMSNPFLTFQKPFESIIINIIINISSIPPTLLLYHRASSVVVSLPD